MKHPKHILLPTDFEAASGAALELAISLAQAFDAKLTLLHVWEIPIYPYMEFMLNSELIAGVEARALQRLTDAAAGVRQTLPAVTSKLKTGQPWSAILEAIDETQADLVVMGTHGRRGLSHVLLGSVAEKVVRLSPVPVLTVRPPVAT
jgi:nucleotide-binding universal stress UspA family protein